MHQSADISRKTAALLAMAAQHEGALVDNLRTDVTALPTRAGTIPATRNDGDATTCYVCCPSAAYIDYALSELRHFRSHRALSLALHGLVAAARPVLRASGVDRHVQPNNWLLATNPPVDLDAGELDALTALLVARHPRHAVVWRSLNACSDAARLARFAAAGYELYPARQVYLFDCRQRLPAVHRDERRDRVLLARTDYAPGGPEGIAESDYARMAELYGMLYLDKYTRLNPHYSAGFVAAAHRAGLLAFHGLRGADGRLDGVIGFFELGEVMTAPLVGYDTSRPQALGLYRRLMAIGLGRARERRLLFNMSAGAAGFKRNRGAVAAIEYAAVYSRHLPLAQRAACRLIRTVLERVGTGLLTRFAL